MTALLVVVTLLLALPPSVASERVLGIDLGSTTTRVAVVSQAGSLPEILPNSMGSRSIPSTVGFSKQGERLTGERAASSPCASCVFTGVRDLLGEVAPTKPGFWGQTYAPYNISKDPERGTALLSSLGGREYSPEELVAMLLQEAAAQFGSPGSSAGSADVAGVVVSVPPFWTERRRQAVIDACEIAGLPILAIISDHAAAALQLGVEQPVRKGDRSRRVVIYGMGAHSVFATLVRYSTYTSQVRSGGKGRPPVAAAVPQVEVKRVHWDSTVGGWALDNKLVEHLAQQFNEQLKGGQGASATAGEEGDVRGDPRAMVKLMAAARKAKEVLSTNNEARVHINTLFKGHDFSTVVDKLEFEELVADLLDRATAPLSRLLKGSPAVDAVEVVGGSVRVPALQQRLRETLKTSLGRDMHLGRHINTDEAVALGAGLRAANLTANAKAGKVLPRIGLRDIAPYSVKLSIASGGGELELVKVGDELPAKKAISVPTRVADFEITLTVTSGSGASGSSLPAGLSQQTVSSFKVTGVPAALAKAQADAKNQKGGKASAKDKKKKKKEEKETSKPKPVTSVDVVLELAMSRSGLMDLNKAYASAGKSSSKYTLEFERSKRGLPQLKAAHRSKSQALLKELAKAELKRSAAAEARNSLEGLLHMALDDLESYPLPEHCLPMCSASSRSFAPRLSVLLSRPLSRLLCSAHLPLVHPLLSEHIPIPLLPSLSHSPCLPPLSLPHRSPAPLTLPTPLLRSFAPRLSFFLSTYLFLCCLPSLTLPASCPFPSPTVPLAPSISLSRLLCSIDSHWFAPPPPPSPLSLPHRFGCRVSRGGTRSPSPVCRAVSGAVRRETAALAESQLGIWSMKLAGWR